jgi:hypothetical protein
MWLILVIGRRLTTCVAQSPPISPPTAIVISEQSLDHVTYSQLLPIARQRPRTFPRTKCEF